MTIQEPIDRLVARSTLDSANRGSPSGTPAATPGTECAVRPGCPLSGYPRARFRARGAEATPAQQTSAREAALAPGCRHAAKCLMQYGSSCGSSRANLARSTAHSRMARVPVGPRVPRTRDARCGRSDGRSASCSRSSPTRARPMCFATRRRSAATPATSSAATERARCACARLPEGPGARDIRGCYAADASSPTSARSWAPSCASTFVQYWKKRSRIASTVIALPWPVRVSRKRALAASSNTSR